MGHIRTSTGPAVISPDSPTLNHSRIRRHA
jgi:hypothetical protein